VEAENARAASFIVARFQIALDRARPRPPAKGGEENIGRNRRQLPRLCSRAALVILSRKRGTPSGFLLAERVLSPSARWTDQLYLLNSLPRPRLIWLICARCEVTTASNPPDLRASRIALAHASRSRSIKATKSVF